MSEPESLPDPPSEAADFQLASQPHDAYFKQVFSDPAHAAAFFRSHLAAPVSSAIQWQELAVVPGSFIKRTLTQTHADLLFSASEP